MKLFRYVLLCCALVAGGMAAPASAGDSAPDASFSTLLPYRGMYYTPGHGGTGLTLDVDANGHVFGVFYAYTDAGQPYFYLMEGQYQPSKEYDRLTTGVLGTFEATPYIAENGECVGPGCTYKNPTRTGTSLHASIVWTAPRVATLTIGSQSWNIRGGEYTVPDEDVLAGQWTFSGVYYLPSGAIASFGSFTLAKLDHNADWLSKLGPVIQGLSSDVTVYGVTWVRPSWLFDGSAQHPHFMLYDHADGSVWWLGATSVFGQLSNIHLLGQLYLTGPQTMHGRVEGFSFDDKGVMLTSPADINVGGDYFLSKVKPVTDFRERSQ